MSCCVQRFVRRFSKKTQSQKKIPCCSKPKLVCNTYYMCCSQLHKRGCVHFPLSKEFSQKFAFSLRLLLPMLSYHCWTVRKIEIAFCSWFCCCSTAGVFLFFTFLYFPFPNTFRAQQQKKTDRKEEN